MTRIHWFKWGDTLTYKELLATISKENARKLNIDFGFELNDYDDAIIGLVDDERWEDKLVSNFIYILLPYFI